MYALGHMVIGYLTVRAVDRVCKTKTKTWIALTVGMIPDVDLLLVPFGMVHHTYTHSILLWLPLAVLMLFSTPFVPVYFGIVQHMFDDALVGTVPIFLPLSTVQVGINLGIPSVADTLFEGGAFIIAAMLAYRNGDIAKLLSVQPESFLSIVPLAATSSMTLIASREFKVRLVNYAFSSKNLALMSLAHIVIAAFLLVSCIQGIMALITRHQSTGITVKPSAKFLH